MAELEDEVLEDDYSSEEEQAETPAEEYSKEELRIFKDLKIDPESATTDDLRRMAKILAKTQDTVIKQKKNHVGEPVTKTDLVIDKFVTKNPEYEGKEDEIRKFMSKWLSLEQATKLVEPDKTDENRNKTKESSITYGESSTTKLTWTKAELDDPKMSQEDYNRIMAQIKSWKAKLK